MRYMRRFRFLRSVVLPLMFVALLPACYKWSAMHGPHDDAIQYGRPDRVRVTVTNGSRVEVQAPWIRADSILGLTTQRDTVVFAVSDVARLEQRKWDWVAFGAGYLFLSLVSWAIICSGDDSGFYDPC